MHEKFISLEKELNSFFQEREALIRASLLAILSRQNIFFLGPPGTAKSQIANSICSSIEGAQYFYFLLTRFTSPEEIFGPFSIKALEKDSYRRITTYKLPEAHIAFLDEIFKASSSILNSLLMIMNERIFINDSTAQKVPLFSLFAASNEIPTENETKAFYDRFTLKVQASYIGEDSNFEAMLLRNASGQKPEVRSRLTLEEVKTAQQQVSQVEIPSRIIRLLVKVRKDLRKEGVFPSDRKFAQALDVVKAQAWLEGRDEASEEDLEVLGWVLWDEPEHIPVVIKTINAVANPIKAKVEELLEMAKEIYEEAKKGDTNIALEATTKLKDITKKLNALKRESRNKTLLNEAIKSVQGWNKRIVKEKLGIDL